MIRVSVFAQGGNAGLAPPLSALDADAHLLKFRDDPLFQFENAVVERPEDNVGHEHGRGSDHGTPRSTLSRPI
jgi:hypothetical protein